MKKLLTLLTGVFLLTICHAAEERNLLQNTLSPEQLHSAILHDKQWVPYPSYKDREGWNALLGNQKNALVKQGEKHLSYEWKVIKASDYLEFERSGDRNIMSRPYDANFRALKSLVLAELAEGKGRFVDQIANGIFYWCEVTSWAASAHLVVQKNRRPLPDYTEQIIDLSAGETAALLSWTHYFLKEKLDEVHPLIAERLHHELRSRILDAYKENHYWWMALNRKGVMVNNWNPWCNFNVLQCALLMEDDPGQLAETVYKTMRSVDQFINYTHSDGACEEGPSYWSHAAGKMYEYLDLLKACTNSKADMFNHPMIKNMGEYIVRSYVGNGWVVNFADASAKGKGDPFLIYRYGIAVHSPLMIDFAALMRSRKPDTSPGDGFQPTLEGFRILGKLDKLSPHHEHPPFTWYPETEFCYMHDKESKMFFAAKGGNNGESHNHNDIGTFSLFVDNIPLIVDAGVGTYTRQTFSGERYNIWTMQSDYHNVPRINGVAQKQGSKYRASNTSFDEKKKTFSLNIAGAYPEEAHVNSWLRSYQFDRGQLIIKDKFDLSTAQINNEINFLTWPEPDISTKGKIHLTKDNASVTLSYDPSLFTPSVQTIEQDDPRLSKIWGPALYRLTLKANTLGQKGEYTFTLSPNN